MGCGLFAGGGYGVSLMAFLMMGARIVLVIWLVFIIAKMVKNNNYKRYNNESLRILDEKFINGEITEDEYRLKKKVLNEK